MADVMSIQSICCKKLISMIFNDSNFVKPLAQAENQFLQVLIDKFRLIRTVNGFELHVEINESSPTIWTREARQMISTALSPDKRIATQKAIDDFLESDREVFDYNDPSFPFRLGNGGTLPIVRMKGADYYCLFYRDIHPIGWNIANGGANTRHDILHPDAIVERELREELIVVEPKKGSWYIFDWHDARLRDHPDFAMAQNLWTQRFNERYNMYYGSNFRKILLPLKWSLPPDVDSNSLDQWHHDSISIRFDNAPAIHTGQGFININAEDFGIEFDRIAKISVSHDCVICDGELRNYRLLDQVVGLFSVKKMHELIDKGSQSFLPDKFFWNGEDRSMSDFESIVDEYLKTRNSSLKEMYNAFPKAKKNTRTVSPFNLCPVTRTIIKRHKKIMNDFLQPKPQTKPYNVFISFASEDRLLANQVFRHLSNTSDFQLFFSDVTKTCGGFADQIDEALDSVTAFIAIGSNLNHLYKSWVKYEWRNFHNDLMANRKPSKSPFFAIVSEINPYDLPRPLRDQSVEDIIHGFENALENATDRLSRFINNP